MSNKLKILSFLMFFIMVSTIYFITGIVRGNTTAETEDKTNIEAPQEIEEVTEGEAPPLPSTAPEQPEKEQEEAKEDAKEVTKEIAKQFARAYYNYDAENPTAYIEASKPYMTETFYEYVKEHPRKNTLSQIKTTAQEIDMYPVEGGNQEIAWNAIITGEAIASDDSTTLEESSLWIVLEKEDSRWKVKGATFDAW